MILGSIILIVKNAVSAILDWIPKIRAIFTNKNIPSKTIVIVNDDSGYQNFWHIGSTGGNNPKPLLQIGCKFMVTNITDSPVALAQATWKGIKGEAMTTIVSVKDMRSAYWGAYDIPPRARTSVSIDFMIATKEMPAIDKAIKLNIGIIDQFGNKHWVKRVVLRSA